MGVFDNPKFTSQDVIQWKIDSYLIKMAEDIRDWGRPIFWMYPREPSIQPAPGYDGGGYGPNGNMTRGEVIKFAGSAIMPNTETQQSLTDRNVISICADISMTSWLLSPRILPGSWEPS